MRYRKAKPSRHQALPPIRFPSSQTFISGDIVMNTAGARRLAFGDRVAWIGMDDYQFTGLGTITRITPHEVEVRWDSETVMRYRRAHLHNLRRVKPILETVKSSRFAIRSAETSFDGV